MIPKPLRERSAFEARPAPGRFTYHVAEGRGHDPQTLAGSRALPTRPGPRPVDLP